MSGRHRRRSGGRHRAAPAWRARLGSVAAAATLAALLALSPIPLP